MKTTGFSAPDGVALPRVIDQYATHGLRGGAVEVDAIVEMSLAGAGQAEIGFVNERGRLERVILALAKHIVIGQLPQLAVDERHELLERVRVALVPSSEREGYVAHEHWRFDARARRSSAC